jgi:hypothetical protein
VNSGFLLVTAIFLPIITLIVVNWAVYMFTYNNFYLDAWMMPTLLILSTFLAGAFIRQRIEDEARGGMGLFFLGVVGLAVFAGLTALDIHTSGGVYSRLMPKLLRFDMHRYVMMLPAVGMAGMLCYKHFTLKHYS